jgi:predicted ABC-type transport system involved in lysophospholipase L1 biosynthesis ATPase subunit
LISVIAGLLVGRRELSVLGTRWRSLSTGRVLFRRKNLGFVFQQFSAFLR